MASVKVLNPESENLQLSPYDHHGMVRSPVEVGTERPFEDIEEE